MAKEDGINSRMDGENCIMGNFMIDSLPNISRVIKSRRIRCSGSAGMCGREESLYGTGQSGFI